MSRTLTLVVISVLALLLGCDRDDREVLNVYAASSLGDAFAELEREFEARNPDVDVRLNLSGSQVLAVQIEAGAPADVFATADGRHMERLRNDDLVESAQVFARNRLILIVPDENPAGIQTFRDLPDAERLVVGSANAPIGHYTDGLFEAAARTIGHDFDAAVRASIVSRESNVRQVRAKVAIGEADAAVVYQTDGTANGVRQVAIPPSLSPLAEYEIAVVDGPRNDLAQDWTSFILSPTGRTVLARHGFLVESEAGTHGSPLD